MTQRIRDFILDILKRHNAEISTLVEEEIEDRVTDRLADYISRRGLEEINE